jgi:hypothetical protein
MEGESRKQKQVIEPVILPNLASQQKNRVRGADSVQDYGHGKTGAVIKCRHSARVIQRQFGASRDYILNAGFSFALL